MVQRKKQGGAVSHLELYLDTLKMRTANRAYKANFSAQVGRLELIETGDIFCKPKLCLEEFLAGFVINKI